MKADSGESSMGYSLDLRERVVGYVQEGGSPTTAAQIFKVSRATVYRWLNREDLRPTKVKTRKRKIDLAALQQDVDQYPEARLKERAQRFGVQPSAIYYALRKLQITRKKRVRVSRAGSRRENSALQGLEGMGSEVRE